MKHRLVWGLVLLLSPLIAYGVVAGHVWIFSGLPAGQALAAYCIEACVAAIVITFLVGLDGM